MAAPEIPQQIPGELVERIASGNAAVFVGAGLSQGAGLPDTESNSDSDPLHPSR